MCGHANFLEGWWPDLPGWLQNSPVCVSVPVVQYIRACNLLYVTAKSCSDTFSCSLPTSTTVYANLSSVGHPTAIAKGAAAGGRNTIRHINHSSRRRPRVNRTWSHVFPMTFRFRGGRGAIFTEASLARSSLPTLWPAHVGVTNSRLDSQVDVDVGIISTAFGYRSRGNETNNALPGPCAQ